MATVATGFPVKEYKSGYTRLISQVTLANSEVYALEHPEISDSNKVRKVYIVNDTSGAVNPAGIASIVLTDADTTTITASGSGAGTYNIVIEL